MMETVTKTDVIIVGAGPTGLSLAAQLIRYDIDFIIFDSKAGVTDGNGSDGLIRLLN